MDKAKLQKPSSIAILLISANFLFFAFSPTCKLLAKNKKLNENEAEAIINAHFQDYYVFVRIGKTKVSFNKKKKYKSLKASADKYKDFGLINYRLFTEDYGTIKVIDIKLTKKGQKTHHIAYDNDDTILGFLAGQRKIIKFVKMEPEEEMVYFVYMFQPNNLGVALGHSKKKYRGRAKIVYDPFLEKFAFRGVEWSPWERQEWKDNTTWIYQKEGNEVFTIGVK